MTSGAHGTESGRKAEPNERVLAGLTRHFQELNLTVKL
jgi:hypothetical protein